MNLSLKSRVPKKVKQWLKLRRAYERRLLKERYPKIPRVLPIEKIGPIWYFVDERLRQYRNVMDPDDFIEVSPF